MKKATLKQIADVAGVSMTTVHRALNGKGGCSKELEQTICQIAKEQGYTPNLSVLASSKPPVQIALIFPFRDLGGKYTVDRILDGYLEYRRGFSDRTVIFQEFLLRANDDRTMDYLERDYEELEDILKRIYAEKPVHFDGVIVFGLCVNKNSEVLLKRIMERGTKVIILERAMLQEEGACCVMGNSRMCGSIAGEILSQHLHSDGTVVIISQKTPTGDAATESCMEYLHRVRPELKVVELPLLMKVDKGESIAQFLKSQRNLVGVYATSGRHTKSLIDALREMGIKELSVIGTELFEESRQALQDKVISVVLDKMPTKIGYSAVHIMTNALLKEKKLPTVHMIPPRIIIHSNADAYDDKREIFNRSNMLHD